MHLDVMSASLGHQAVVVARALRLGATIADIGQGDVPWTVLADPEGNEFCVLEPRPEYLGIGPVAAVVIDSVNPAESARSWARDLGLPVAREQSEFASIRRDGSFWIEFVRVDQIPEQGRVRIACS